ncbi:MAG: UvrB/UvrC motif-containing protein [Clostridiales bacterium]|nr:UvrB/UvrC motif-containing protein [Clostridiales bacterium]
MLCERCKIREANIQYTEIVNGVKTEHHFCAQCARELDFGPYAAIFDSDFPLGKLLSGLLGIGESQEDDLASQVVCPTCKTSYGEFVKNSRFGCPDCYGVFDLLINEKIKQLQGNTSHKGKQPKIRKQVAVKAVLPEDGTEVEPTVSWDQDVKEQICILDARLKEALKSEQYEIAARCRDQIRELKARENNGAEVQ